MLWSSVIYGQVEFDKTYDSEGVNHVVIDNLKGDIIVKAGSSDQIIIKATSTTTNRIAEMELKEYRTENVLAVYLHNPCKKGFTRFDPEKPFRFIQTENNCQWGGKFDEQEIPKLTLEIEIPTDMNVYVSTIIEGDIDVRGISGVVYASNVNGSIKMHEVSKVKNGTTVNGNIDINYRNKPSITGRFSTINGEINLNMPKNSSLTTNFKSFQGELYTDFDAVQLSGNIKNQETLNPGEMVKVGEYAEAQIGTGEINLFIETFNGNAYLKQIK
ncbi:hypothetical protein GCM10007940_16850 [Portibacter lacus]|uniref:Adhesin domain-containing protein n=2 Tax=Portibacter lacus TaxID=1099794 RepID=A0AA37WFP7_9BACT|nr:hypothetical protein GCM10007940_16850 [Portibacter lacus]